MFPVFMASGICRRIPVRDETRMALPHRLVGAAILLLLAIVLFPLSESVPAAETTPGAAAGNTPGAAPRTVRVGWYEASGLFRSAEDGRISGYVPALLETMSRLTGWRYEWVELSHDEIPAALAEGRIDLSCDTSSATLPGRPNMQFSSIAAGVASESLKAWLPDSARVLRAMPNTPAMVGAGATALCEDTATFTEEEKAWVKELFDQVGKAIWVPERLMDAVVGVSGSGPAYVFLFIEAMADGGVRMGLPRATAMELAVQTVLGSAKLCAESGMHPGALKDMVCSPGGTTIEAVAELEKRGLRASVIEAVRACAEKSANLS